MIFIESPAFTEDVKKLLTDESYARLQLHLAEYPFTGDVIKDTGGLRKVRWASGGKGKSGGVRVIYFHVHADAQIRNASDLQEGDQGRFDAEGKEGPS